MTRYELVAANKSGEFKNIFKNGRTYMHEGMANIVARDWELRTGITVLVNKVEVTTDKEMIAKLEEQLKEAREVFGDISKTDISEKAPDIIWLSGWRNKTKQIARAYLEKYKEAK